MSAIELETAADLAAVGEAVTWDQLVGGWHIHQLRRGHRFSTDDLLVAGAAIRARPAARRLLDLGAGIGTVGLLTLHAMPADARLTQLEVQEISHRLARATARRNGIQGRVTSLHGDLRTYALPEAAFDLITGSPPYIPVGKGLISPHPQRAGARIELRGDVFDYCAAAARALAPGGAFCFCHAAIDPRPEPAIRAAGLALLARQDVIFRQGREPAIALFTCAREGERGDLPPLVVRDERGEWTPDYLALRERMNRRGW